MVLSPVYPIVDVGACARAGKAPRDVARAVFAGGARLVQLRAKAMDSGPFLDLAQALVADGRATGAGVIVNDRADLARLADAAGVHVGQDDLSVADVRRVAGADAIVGLSTHTEDQLREAVEQAVQYVAIGPVYATNTKDTGYQAVGVEMVRRAAAIASSRGLPVVAIGGVTLERAREVWAAGATSIAVISDLLTDDPAARVADWLRAHHNSTT